PGEGDRPYQQALKGRNSPPRSAPVAPFQGSDRSARPAPRALPWAVMLRPFGAKTRCRRFHSSGKPLPPRRQPCRQALDMFLEVAHFLQRDEAVVVAVQAAQLVQAAAADPPFVETDLAVAVAV